VVLLVCGALVVWESRSGGFRNMEDPSGSPSGYWPGFCWMSAALLANAALITTIGFILSCSLCFVLAVRGLRNADRQDSPSGFDLAQLLRDAAIGVAIAAPVYWMFTKLLAINLPGLTSTGWI
jgi:putative tricarboxylic transport membrane protein